MPSGISSKKWPVSGMHITARSIRTASTQFWTCGRGYGATDGFVHYAKAVDVSEPSSLLLCGTAAPAGAYRWWRRRKMPPETQP
jgi:hypothetical protein